MTKYSLDILLSWFGTYLLFHVHSNCCFSTCIQISQETGTSISKNFPQFVVIHTVKGFGIVNKADVFLGLFCFFDDPMDVGNLISDSSAFSKFSLTIWKFTVLLKPGLENFEYYFASMWDEHNCVAVWTFFGIAFLWDCNENWLFQSCCHCWVFQICWHFECSTFTVSSFRIWNSSTGIPLCPLAFFIVRLHKAHLTLHYKMSGSRWVITPLWLYGHEDLFLYSSFVYSCHLNILRFC